MKYLYRYGGLLLIILLANCAKQSEPKNNVVTNESYQSSAKLKSAETNEGVIFVVTPSVIDNCHSVNHIIDVNWDVKELGITSVTIYADDGESEQKIWVKGGAVGHETTGNWIKNNSTLRLVDSATGKTLALHQFHESDCATKK